MTERSADAGTESTGGEDTSPRLRLGGLKAKLAQVTGDATGTATAVRPAPGRGPRRARLTLSRVDPWSMMKVSFLLSVAFGVVTFVAVLIVWSVLSMAGLWDSVNEMLAPFSPESGPPLDIRDYIGLGRGLGFTRVVAVGDVVLLTALAPLTAFLYNLAAALLGGVQLTLTEEDHR